MTKKVIRLGLDAATWIAFGLVVTGGVIAAGAWFFKGDHDRHANP